MELAGIVPTIEEDLKKFDLNMKTEADMIRITRRYEEMARRLPAMVVDGVPEYRDYSNLKYFID